MSLFAQPNQITTLSDETLSLESLSVMGVSETAELKALAMDIDKLRNNIAILKNKKSNAFESYAALSTAVETASFYGEVDSDIDGLEIALEGLIGNFFKGVKSKLATFKRAAGRTVGLISSMLDSVDVVIADLEKVTDYDQSKVDKKWKKRGLAAALPITKLGKEFDKVAKLYAATVKWSTPSKSDIIAGKPWAAKTPTGKLLLKNAGRVGPMPYAMVMDITAGEEFSDLTANRHRLIKSKTTKAPTAKELLKFAKEFQANFNPTTVKVFDAEFRGMALFDLANEIHGVVNKNRDNEDAIRFGDEWGALLNATIDVQWFWVVSVNSIVKELVAVTKLYTK